MVKTLKILIAEDEENIVNLIRLILGDKYELVVVNDGEEAIKLAENLKPDLIILDVMMPKINGFQVCETLKKDKRTNQIKIIFLSAKVMKNDVSKGLSCGAIDYIKKPFEPEEFERRIKSAIELR
ncbi:response regulator [Candidatus Woesearchaeota archaeon]|nr:response regulator [Candidatus Woesearchaeota archaeon]